MCGENHDRSRRNFLKILDKDCAFGFELADDVGVVNDRATDVDWGTVHGERVPNRIDRPANSGTKTAGRD